MTTPTDPRSAAPPAAVAAERRSPSSKTSRLHRAEDVRSSHGAGPAGSPPEPGRREYLWNRAWALLPYATLPPSTAVAVADAPDRTARGVILVLAVILAGWHGWWILKHPRWWERALVPMAAYFVGALVLLAVLRGHDDVFSFAVAGFFPTAFVALPGAWAYAGVASLSLLTVPNGPQSLWQGWPRPGDLLFPAATTALVAFIGAMTRRVEREAIRRREINAELVALADENAALQSRLVEQARQAGVTAERTRLARDIHDTVAQGLAGIVTQLETAEAEATPEATARRLRIARDLARDSLVEVRRSVAALRPAALDEAELAGALTREVDGWRHRNDAAATFTVTGAPTGLDPAVEEAVLRVAQEALSNVARHAHATRLGVTLSYMEDMLVLDVRDDGRGFAVPEATGFGLSAMRQRVRELGGEVGIESRPGAGTAVSVTVPIGAAR